MVVRAGNAFVGPCLPANWVGWVVGAVGGETDQQLYTDVLSCIVQ